MKRFMLVASLILISGYANAADLYGRVWTSYTDGEFTADQTVVGVRHSFDKEFSAEVAVDPLQTGDVVRRANLAWTGFLMDGAVLRAGVQQPVYLAHMYGKGLAWVAQPYAQATLPEHDGAWSYSGSVSGVGFALETRDGVKGDSKGTTGGLLTYSVMPELELLVGYENDAAAEVATTRAAVSATCPIGLLVIAEYAATAAKDDAVEDANSYSATANYTVNEKYGVYANYTTGNDAFKAANYDSSALLGVTRVLTKGLNAAVLAGKVEIADESEDSVALRLAADF